MADHTVSVTAVEGQNALLMMWQREVEKEDVRAAFQDMAA